MSAPCAPEPPEDEPKVGTGQTAPNLPKSTGPGPKLHKHDDEVEQADADARADSSD